MPLLMLPTSVQRPICASCDLNKLDWLRTNQTTIRVDLYNGLSESLQPDENANAATMGRRFILPSSYPGGDRYMQRISKLPR